MVTATSKDGATGTTKISYSVDAAATASTLSSTLNPSVVGQKVTYTATVSVLAPASGTPTGTVTFTDGSTTICNAVALNGSDQASCQATYTAVGSHAITATYNGSTDFLRSPSKTLTQNVHAAQTETTLAANANPSVFGPSRGRPR
jgi:hypothetical protein